MSPSAALLFFVASLGADTSWEPLAEGGLQLTVRLEPSQLQRLKPGDEITSEVPPKNRDLRRVAFVVGPDNKLTKVESPPQFRSIVAKPENPPLTAVANGGEKSPEKVVPKGADATSNNSARNSNKSDSNSTEIVGPAFPEGNLNVTPPGEKGGHLATDVPPSKEPSQARAEAEPTDNRKVAALEPWQSAMDKKDGPPTNGENPRVAGYSPTDAANVKPTVAKENFDWVLYGLGGGLVASLAANVFLGWVNVGQRSRYRELARKLFASSPSNPT